MEVALSSASQSPASAGWDDVHLVPSSLPEVGLGDVDLSVEFLGRRLRAPLLIAGMTGGHAAALDVNTRLGMAAQRLGLAVGVGSQRAALLDSRLVPTYSVVRTHAPSAFVLGNVGASQLVPQRDHPSFTMELLEEAVGMVQADALAVHLNVLEEMVQVEGDHNTVGIVSAIAGVSSRLSVPVIAKETGAGLDQETALLLAAAGVAAVDVGGVGGTSFARVEGIRAEQAGDVDRARLGRVFESWGIPTAASILEVRGGGLPIIATGGVRNGLDVAKALALGVELVGVGRPFLKAAQQGVEALVAEIEAWLHELRVAMLLCGARDVPDLRRRPPVVTGSVLAWAQQRRLI